MGVLSVKYKPKSLFSIGILIFAVSAITSFYSNSLTTLFLTYSIVGVAYSIVIPMINTIIGIHVPTEKRTTVIGWTVAGLSTLYLIGSLSVGYLSQWGWRTTLLLVVVPISIIIFTLSRIGISEPENSSSQNISVRELFNGYATVFRNKSAIGCILGTVLGMATWSLYLIYGASYWRQQFLMSTTSISYSMILLTFGFIVGSLSSGRLVTRLSSKQSLLISTGVLGLVTLFALNAPSYWVSFVLAIIASISAGIVVTVSSSFSLEQIPEYQGTMMSLYSAADSLGTTVSATVGGYLILVYGYGSCSVVIGLMGLLGALAFQYLTTNPQ